MEYISRFKFDPFINNTRQESTIKTTEYKKVMY